MTLSLTPGDTIGARYELRGLLGRGGMATVYRAYDPKLNLDVALKVLPPQLAAEKSFVARFRREGQTLAKLTHPNILRLYEIGEDAADCLYYLVLEYLTRGSLKDRHMLQRWPVEQVSTVLRPVAAALDFAHGQRLPVVHRDLKPSNIMFGQSDQPVICDFGLAKLLEQDLLEDDSLRLSLTVNQIVGTPAYMSPEQAAGLVVGPPSDRYSLAVVAYELLTASVPFAADTVRSTMRMVIEAPLPPPSTRNPTLDSRLDAVFARALAKEPADRFATAERFVDALAAASESLTQTEARGPVRRMSDRQTVTASGHVDAQAAATRAQHSGTVERTRRSRAAATRTWLRGAAAAALLVGAVTPFAVLRPGAAEPLTYPPATPPRATAAEIQLPVVTPTPLASESVAATRTSTPALPTAAPTSTLPPVPTPRATATPTLDQAWQNLLADLEVSWNRDWPAAIATASRFAEDHPDFGPASEKLYAARLFYADGLLADGRTAEAIEQLEAADMASPERPEAHQTLVALTPTATPLPAPPRPPPPTSVRELPAHSTQRAPLPQVNPQQSPGAPSAPAPLEPPAAQPTPTRAPFVPR